MVWRSHTVLTYFLLHDLLGPFQLTMWLEQVLLHGPRCPCGKGILWEREKSIQWEGLYQPSTSYRTNFTLQWTSCPLQGWLPYLITAMDKRCDGPLLLPGLPFLPRTFLKGIFAPCYRRLSQTHLVSAHFCLPIPSHPSPSSPLSSSHQSPTSPPPVYVPHRHWALRLGTQWRRFRKLSGQFRVEAAGKGTSSSLSRASGEGPLGRCTAANGGTWM